MYRYVENDWVHIGDNINVKTTSDHLGYLPQRQTVKTRLLLVVMKMIGILVTLVMSAYIDF